MQAELFEPIPELKTEVIEAEKCQNDPRDIENRGDSASLRRFGEILIGVSKTNDCYVHLESDEPSAIEAELPGLRLTITSLRKLQQLTVLSLNRQTGAGLSNTARMKIVSKWLGFDVGGTVRWPFQWRRWCGELAMSGLVRPRNILDVSGQQW